MQGKGQGADDSVKLASEVIESNRRILEMAAEGLTYPDIAREIGQSPGTVKNRAKTLLDAMGADNMQHAIAIVLMTTNHRDLLDPALIRPGRVDFEVKFSTATQSQLRRLYARFFPNSNGDATIWAMTMEGKTMAEAQRDLLLLKKAPSNKAHYEPAVIPA